jgi:hypothetical protein
LAGSLLALKTVSRFLRAARLDDGRWYMRISPIIHFPIFQVVIPLVERVVNAGDFVFYPTIHENIIVADIHAGSYCVFDVVHLMTNAGLVVYLSDAAKTTISPTTGLSSVAFTRFKDVSIAGGHPNDVFIPSTKTGTIFGRRAVKAGERKKIMVKARNGKMIEKEVTSVYKIFTPFDFLLSELRRTIAGPEADKDFVAKAHKNGSVANWKTAVAAYHGIPTATMEKFYGSRRCNDLAISCGFFTGIFDTVKFPFDLPVVNCMLYSKTMLQSQTTRSAQANVPRLSVNSLSRVIRPFDGSFVYNLWNFPKDWAFTNGRMTSLNTTFFGITKSESLFVPKFERVPSIHFRMVDESRYGPMIEQVTQDKTYVARTGDLSSALAVCSMRETRFRYGLHTTISSLFEKHISDEEHMRVFRLLQVEFEKFKTSKHHIALVEFDSEIAFYLMWLAVALTLYKKEHSAFIDMERILTTITNIDPTLVNGSLSMLTNLATSEPSYLAILSVLNTISRDVINLDPFGYLNYFKDCLVLENLLNNEAFVGMFIPTIVDAHNMYKAPSAGFARAMSKSKVQIGRRATRALKRK